EHVVLENENLRVSTFPLSHRIAGTGFRFDEKKRLPTIDRAKVAAVGVPTTLLPAIKRGQDYTAPDGTVHRWQELTIDPAQPRSYAYCSDTVRTPGYLPYIQQVDLLYHEATFLHEMHDRAVATYHTTALQAAEIAAEVGAKKLLIGHYSARYKDLKPRLHESKSVFPDTQLALEGSWYTIQFIMTTTFDLTKLLRENIRQRTPYYAARHELKGGAYVLRDANENAFGSPLDRRFNRYPDPLQHQLKLELSTIKGVPARNMFLGNGSDEAIDILFRAFCRPGIDNVILTPPTYGMYEVSANINDVA